MANANNIQLGSCSVTYKGVDLGHTIGGVSVKYTPEFKDTAVDQYGSSKVQKWLVGEMLTAEFNLAEFTLANLLNAIALGTQVADDSISIGSYAGKKLSTTAGLLVLHPLQFATSVKDYDVALYRAVISNEIELKHTNEDEKVIPIVAEALVDEGRSDGNLLGFIGDSIG